MLTVEHNMTYVLSSVRRNREMQISMKLSHEIDYKKLLVFVEHKTRKAGDKMLLK